MKTFIHLACLAISLMGFSLPAFAQIRYYKGPTADIRKAVREPLLLPTDCRQVSIDKPTKPVALKPSQYGIPSVVNVSLKGPERADTWYVRILASEAKSVDVVLSALQLAPTAKLFIYNEQLTTVMGPVTAANNGRVLGTLTFPGQAIYLKVVEGSSGAASTFTLASITYGLMDPPAVSNANARSVNCIPDARCFYGWENEWEMVGRIQISGYQGTGTFINNEALNRRPFFLTAFHVIDTDNDDALSSAEINALSSVIVQIDLRTTSCNGSVATGSLLYGATFRSAWNPTDFCLIEMNNTPNINQVVNYAGWSRSGSTPNQGISLHHPSGQYLRYSTSTSGGVRQHPLHSRYWQVHNWDQGIVAPGSSGCALFNEYHQVVGQLKGGATSCDFMDLADRYGKFSDSWYGGGTSDTQLKAWLSPNQDLSSMSHLLPLTMTGGGNVCYGTNTTVTMPYVLPGESASWSVSGNLTIVSSTYNTVTVTGSYQSGSGLGSVIATFGGAQASKNIYYGTPDVYAITYDNNQPASTYNYVSPNTQHNVYLNQQNAMAANITSVNWNPSPYTGYSFGQYNASYNFTLYPGDVLYFNPLSATNQCGTASRTLVFAASSSYRTYPNPATTTMHVEFNSVEHAETLPDEVQLISEATGKAVKTVAVKQAFASKRMTDGNKLILDVSQLARGRYYLQVRDRSKTEKIQPIRIILSE